MMHTFTKKFQDIAANHVLFPPLDEGCQSRIVFQVLGMDINFYFFENFVTEITYSLF